MKKVSTVFLVLITISCGFNSRPKKVVYGNGITKYNYLDKPHELLYVYDFDSVLSNLQRNNIKEKIIGYEKENNISTVVVSNRSIIGKTELEDAKSLSMIFRKNFNLEELILLKLSMQKGELTITSSPSLEKVLTDSILNRVIKQTIFPYFVEEKYYDGLGVDSLMIHIKN